MTNQYNLNSKDNNFLSLSSFGELIIDHWKYAFESGFEIEDKNNPLQIDSSINKGGKVFFHMTSLMTILFQLPKSRFFWI